jgi:hypothetical protein
MVTDKSSIPMLTMMAREGTILRRLMTRRWRGRRFLNQMQARRSQLRLFRLRQQSNRLLRVQVGKSRRDDKDGGDDLRRFHHHDISKWGRM